MTDEFHLLHPCACNFYVILLEQNNVSLVILLFEAVYGDSRMQLWLASKYFSSHWLQTFTPQHIMRHASKIH